MKRTGELKNSNLQKPYKLKTQNHLLYIYILYIFIVKYSIILITHLFFFELRSLFSPTFLPPPSKNKEEEMVQTTGFDKLHNPVYLDSLSNSNTLPLKHRFTNSVH